ncbi:SH3 domain-containing protein [Sphingopyxis fribergensis]
MKYLFCAALAAGGALVVSVPASADYVSANTLNCRAGPAATQAVVAKLDRGQNVEVAETSGTWSRLAAPDCWVLTRYLSDDYVASSSTAPSSLYGSTTSGSNSYGLSTPRSTRVSTKKKPKSSKRRSSSTQSGCPCSGSQICIGPRGGRYCITSGGNKRYGV